MKTIRNILTCALLLLIIGAPMLKAQPLPMIEKTEVYDKEHIPKKDPAPYPFIREADIMYEKTVWRMLNLREKMNQPLYFPLKPMGDRKNLVQLLLDILENPLPGHQVFAYNPDMTYEFEVPISMEDIYKKLGAVEIEIPVEDSITGAITYVKTGEIDMRLDDISRLYIKEKWFFDRRYSTFQVRIIGICPITITLEEEEDPVTFELRKTGNIRREMLFWVYYPEIRYYLAKQEAFNPMNDAQRVSFDDLLTQRRFSSWIYKETNVHENRIINDYTSGMDAMFEAERIKYELFEIEHDLWEY